jgi:signal transduction histidine kinase
VPRFSPDGSFAGYIGSCVDITEQKLAGEAQSTVNRRLIQAHEEERTWIARELHDDINQRVALLAVKLDGLKHRLPASAAEVRREIEAASQQVVELGSDVQALSHRLHSSKLGYLGLEAAATSFCRELSDQTGVKIEFTSENIPKRLPEEISLCLFRVLQEALQNATKHSGSLHLQVSLKTGGNEVDLTVHDSGIGFDAEEAMKKHGLGLTSMKERLKLVDGQLSIDSKAQRGTTIHARVPFNSRPVESPSQFT